MREAINPGKEFSKIEQDLLIKAEPIIGVNNPVVTNKYTGIFAAENSYTATNAITQRDPACVIKTLAKQLPDVDIPESVASNAGRICSQSRNEAIHRWCTVCWDYSKQGNKANELWVMERESTKLERKELTGVVKDFVRYARECDSHNAEFYYKAFTKLAYKAIGIRKPKKKTRDTLSAKQLNQVARLEDTMADLISECMGKGISYKKIFQNVKKKIASVNPDQEATPAT